MARYAATDISERRTKPLRSWVTPDEHKRLRADATSEGKPLSDYIRQLCLRRRGKAPVVAGVCRSPEAKQLADELRAIGNNHNQLARIANTTGELRREAQLTVVIDQLVEAIERVIQL
jgi:hypothetical protein